MPISWIEHKGQRLLLIDVSNLTNNYSALRSELEKVVALVQNERKGSVLACADLRNTYLNNNALLALMSNAPFAAPYFRKSAMVIENSNSRRIVLDTLGSFVGHLPKRFDDSEAAKDWLAEQ